MNIRKSTIEDIPRMQEIYAIARKFMVETGNPYATIHRIASCGEVKGIFHTVLHFALQHYNTIRIDTHPDNVVMQHLVGKTGFQYCGIIYCWPGAKRLAYQYN